MTIRHPTQAELFADVACQGPRPPLSSMAGMDRVDAAVVISPEAVSTTTPKILDRNDKPATLAEAYEAACAAEWASKDKLIGLRSSLRLIERATSRKLRELPAYPPELGPILEAVRPDNIRSDTDASNQSGVSPKRWSNAKSEVGRLLRAFGLPTRQQAQELSQQSAWCPLLSAISSPQHRGALRPFAQFCAARRLDPNDVTEEVLNNYVEWRQQGAPHTPATRLARDLRRIWNQAGSQVPGWPAYRFTSPTPAHVDAFPLAALSAAFQADLTVYLEDRKAGDPFDFENRRTAKEATLKSERALLIRAASILGKYKSEAHYVKAISDLVRPDNARTVLKHMYRKAGDSWQPQARTMATVLARAARDYVKVPGEQQQELQKPLDAISQCINSRRRPGLPERVQQKLRPFDDPEMRRRFLQLPDKLYARASLSLAKKPVRAAQQHEIALALELLIVDPIRRSNLAAIDLARHVQRDIEGKIVGLFIAASEVKNGMPIDTVFKRSLAGNFERHLTMFRPHIRGASGSALFPSPNGGPLNAANLARRLSQTVRKELGVDFTPQLMRHLAATMLYEEDPSYGPVVQRLLRHTTLKQTELMYGERRGRGAQDVWRKIIEKEIGGDAGR